MRKKVLFMMCVALSVLGFALTGCGGDKEVEEVPEQEKSEVIPAQEGVEGNIEYLFMGEFDTGIIGNATVHGNLYYDGYYDVTASLFSYSSTSTWGTWEYMDGQFVLTDDATGEKIVTERDGERYYFFTTGMSPDQQVEVSAVMSGTKDASMLHVDPDPTDNDKFNEKAISNQLDPKSMTEEELAPVDRYAGYTKEQWDELWADNDYPDHTVDYTGSYTYDTTYEGRFRQTMAKDYFIPADEKNRGHIERIEYDTYIYTEYQDANVPESDWKPVKKACYVYVPAGYDESKQYNVYYMIHGAGQTLGAWFNTTVEEKGATLNGDFITMMDNLIARGEMEPTIFVDITTDTDVASLERKYQYAHSVEGEMNSLPQELANDLIPAVEGKYSTYAKDTSLEGLKESRLHRAFGGLSMGAAITWNIMPETVSFIGYYAPLSNGCGQGNSGAALVQDGSDLLTSLKDLEDKPEIVFAHVGKKDHCYDPEICTLEGFDRVNEGYFTYGDNLFVFSPENGTHTMKYFYLGIVNSMELFFKE
jgi:hypothetical protein